MSSATSLRTSSRAYDPTKRLIDVIVAAIGMLVMRHCAAGARLRRLSLDELPTFWNVLRRARVSSDRDRC